MTNSIPEINKKLLKKFGNPYKAENLPKPIDMLIATILSQNTNDQNSYKAYLNLRKKYPTWSDVNNARRISIEKEIKVAGLGFQKSSAIKNFLKELKTKNNAFSLDHLKNMSDLSAIKYLTEYKGVGVKTASCVLLFSLGKNICPVDTHVHRTLNRIGIVNTKTPEKTFYAINEKFPPKIAHSFHTNLIRLGREICTPKGFTCSICPLDSICQFDDKNFDRKPRSNSRPFMLLDNV